MTKEELFPKPLQPSIGLFAQANIYLYRDDTTNEGDDVVTYWIPQTYRTRFVASVLGEIPDKVKRIQFLGPKIVDGAFLTGDPKVKRIPALEGSSPLRWDVELPGGWIAPPKQESKAKT